MTWDELIKRELPGLTADVEEIGKALDDNAPEMSPDVRIMTTTLLLIAKLRAEMRQQ